MAILRDHYGSPARPITSDPFELILAENVAYLGSDEDRRAALALLRRTVGTRPEQIAHASVASLREVASTGILADKFALKLRACGQIALEEFEGDLTAVLKLPPAAAKKALRQFPGIGEPEAERILLIAGRQRFLAPESNGLRVLVRLGLIPSGRSYTATYAAARPLAGELGPSALQTAHLLLRQHGQILCRRTNPRCPACPLRAVCPSATPSASRG